jgi:hypothetical protein
MFYKKTCKNLVFLGESKFLSLVIFSLRSSIGAKIRTIFELSAHSELKITFRGIIFEWAGSPDIPVQTSF